MRKSISGVVLMFMMAASGLLATAAGQATRDVNVVNTPTIHVGNTANVKVTNLEAREPFVLAPALNGTTPFTFTVPSTTSSGKAVKAVVIEFVTADCAATTGTTFIGVAKISALFNGTFGFYSLPFEAPMTFVNEVEFGSARQTLIFADPGSPISYGLSGGQPTCTVTVSGHLLS